MGLNFTSATIEIEERIEARDALLTDIANFVSHACVTKANDNNVTKSIVKDIDTSINGLSDADKVKVLELLAFNLLKKGSFNGTGEARKAPNKKVSKSGNSRNDYYNDIFGGSRR